MKPFLVIFALFLAFNCGNAQIKGTAQLTWYESYARCCKSNPNYDPSAPTEECTLYSAW